MNSKDSKIILRIEKLTKRFSGVVALKAVDFESQEGEVHAICGENGAGKSTLIKILSGYFPFGSYEGRMFLSGHPVEFSGPADSERAGIAVIYQELTLVQEMTVAENIFLGAEPHRWGLIDWNRVYSETGHFLELFGLDLDPAARVADLGIGKQQLVEILKALSKKSKILLLDEPTAALSETEVDTLLNIITGLKEKGITCIYISHKLDEVLRIADRVTVLRDGEKVATLKTGETDKGEIIRHMVGREITQMYPLRRVSPGETLLQVANLTIAGEGRSAPVLENINLELKTGEVLGIGGLMGSGRTELLMHLFGTFGIRISGEVRIRGDLVRISSPLQAIRHGLMLVSEDRKRYGIVPAQNIGFNISLASLRQFTDGILLNRNREVSHNQRIFNWLGVKAPNLETSVSKLSGGNQQKVVLGKGLMTEPQIIFMDEPTRGIDVGAKVEIYHQINSLTSEGKAVVLVSSELPELMGMSDRLIILSAGKIGGKFDAGEATQEAVMRAAMAFH